ERLESDLFQVFGYDDVEAPRARLPLERLLDNEIYDLRFYVKLEPLFLEFPLRVLYLDVNDFLKRAPVERGKRDDPVVSRDQLGEESEHMELGDIVRFLFREGIGAGLPVTRGLL